MKQTTRSKFIFHLFVIHAVQQYTNENIKFPVVVANL